MINICSIRKEIRDMESVELEKGEYKNDTIIDVKVSSLTGEQWTGTFY